jgi:LPS export ABC transporter protein LptC
MRTRIITRRASRPCGPSGRTDGRRSRPAALLPRLRRLWPLLLAAVLLLGGCYQAEEQTSPPTDERLPDQTIENYQLTTSEAGVKRWVLDSDRMEKFEDQEDVELYGVRMRFYRDGVYHSTLTSERGIANLSTRNLFAWGNVVVVTEDDRRLETEELHYDNVAGRIHNDVFNRYRRGQDWSTGFGLEATPDLDYIEIKRQFQAELTEENAGEDRSP